MAANTIRLVVLLAAWSCSASAVASSNDEWAEVVAEAQAGDVKVESHVLVFSKIQICVQHLTNNHVSTQAKSGPNDLSQMATDQRSKSDVPVSNRGKNFMTCPQRNYNYKSAELSALMLGGKEAPAGVGVYIQAASSVKAVQEKLAMGFGGAEAKICLTLFEGAGCTGKSRKVESAQHRCNSHSTIFAAQTGEVAFPDEPIGMSVQCMRSETASGRRLLGNGARPANWTSSWATSVHKTADALKKVEEAKAKAKETRYKNRLHGQAETQAQSASDTTNPEWKNALAEGGADEQCGFDQSTNSLHQIMDRTHARRLLGTAAQRPGCGIITYWTQHAGQSVPLECGGSFDSRKGFSLGECVTLSGGPCNGAANCVKVECTEC